MPAKKPANIYLPKYLYSLLSLLPILNNDQERTSNSDKAACKIYSSQLTILRSTLPRYMYIGLCISLYTSDSGNFLIFFFTRWRHSQISRQPRDRRILWKCSWYTTSWADSPLHHIRVGMRGLVSIDYACTEAV